MIAKYRVKSLIFGSTIDSGSAQVMKHDKNNKHLCAYVKYPIT